MAESINTLGIISIGEMGLGIAQVLIAHGYRVVTFAEDRSEITRQRARSAGVEMLLSITQLVEQCDCIFSIVPPREAYALAKRIADATHVKGDKALYYLDLNAISPKAASEIESLLTVNPIITYIDGGIIGGTPYPKSNPPSGVTGGIPDWYCPNLIVSGPSQLPSAKLVKALNIDHLPLPIGAATGLKMCYASTTKGFFSLGIQSFVTAHTMGILPQLRAYMQKYNPSTLTLVEKGLVTMPPKAYRWVGEMQEIAKTMEENGGFSRGLFDGVSEVYRAVAEDTELGREQSGRRMRGQTVEDVVELIRKGLEAKKLKVE